MNESPDVTPFSDRSVSPPVVGFLHRPCGSSQDALVLTHGAGANCEAPLLVALARAFAETGFTVLRCDLPFRQKRAHGPPFSGSAKEDRAGLRNAVNVLKELEPNARFQRVFLGGHSYGGRQGTMLASEEAGMVDGLLLCSYPLHPPQQPSQLRTAHFPALQTPALFVHGTRDGFGSVEEIQTALKLISSPTKLIAVEGAGHDLFLGRHRRDQAVALAQRVVAAFGEFFALSCKKSHRTQAKSEA